jgi:hypothetical protein
LQTISGTKSFTGGSGIATSGTYPRTSNSNQQSSTFTTPAIQISSSNDGIYSSAADIIDIGTQGTNYISLQPEGIFRFVGGTVDPAIVFNQRIQALNGAAGATSPAIQIDNQNSGFYRVNQGTIGIGISGVATARWSLAGLNLFGVTGSAGAPAIVMANDTTSGFYRPAADQIGISANGVERCAISNSGVRVGVNGVAQSEVRSGTVSIVINPGIAVGSNVTQVINFSPAFASAPRVIVTNNGGVSGGDGLNCITTNPTTTGFTIVLRNVGTGTTGTGTEIVSWYAWV